MMESQRKNAEPTKSDLTDDPNRFVAGEQTFNVENKYETLVHSAPIIILHLSREGMILEWNPEAERLYGKSRDEVLGGNYFELFLPKEAQHDVLADMAKVADGEPTRGYVNPVLAADGTERIISWNVNPLVDPVSGHTGILAIGQDITEYKAFAKELRASEEKYRYLVENINDVIYMLDKDGVITYVSPAVELNDRGYKPQDSVGKHFSEVVFTEDVHLSEEQFKKVMGGEAGIYEYRMVTKTGDIIWLRDSSRPTIKDGKIVGVQGVIRDITEQKEFQEALERSEEKYRDLVENINDVIFTVDINGNLTYLTPSIQNLIGFSVNEIIGEPFAKFIHPDDLEELNNAFEDVLQGDLYPSEYRVRMKDGGFRWIWSSSKPILHNGSPAGIQGVLRDVTDRKEAELALRKSEEKYRLVINNIPDVVWISDRQGNTSFISPNIKDVYGYSQEEIYDSDEDVWFGRIHPEDLERVKSTYEAVFEKGEKFDLEYRIKRKDGTYIWLHDRGLVNLVDEKSEYVYGIFSDVTERKKTEDKLKVLSYVIEQSDNSIVITDLEGRFEYANLKYLTERGFKSEDIIGMNWEDVLKKSSPYFEKFEKINETVSHQTRMWRGTVLERKEDGEMRWKESLIYPIKDEQGNIAHNVFISTDVTDRKKAEIELKNFFDLSSDAMMIANMEDGGLQRVNPVSEKMFGYSDRELLSMSIFDLDHPRYRAKNIKNLFRAREKGDKSLNFETLVLDKSNKQMWLNVTTNLDPDRDVLYVVGRNISEQKEKHTELMKRLMNFKMEEGNVYLAKEKSVNQSVDAFCDLLGVGFFGTMFSRKQKSRYRCLKEGEFDHYWLAEAEYDGAIEPKVEFLQEILDELPGKDAIFIDRLDYLISKNGFKKVLSFIQRLSELAYLRDMIVIISVDPDLLSPTELRAIEKESKELEPLHKSMLSSELADILKFVYKKTGEKVNADYTGLQEELNISRPTAIKRVWELANFGYLVETKKGKKKVFELTDKGQNLFH